MKKLTPIKTPLRPDFDNLEDRFWWAMCDTECSLPEPLTTADLSKPFVYDRRYGVFEVGIGCHPSVMQMFLAWDHGFYRPMRLEDKHDYFKANMYDCYGLSDFWLENTEGTCYMSSMSSKIICGRKGNLNSKELDYFYPVEYNT